MKTLLPEIIWKIIVCPDCKTNLKKMENGAFCKKCKTHYPFTKSGKLDLRLQKAKKINLDFELGTNLKINSKLDFKPLVKNPKPEVNFSKAKTPDHLSQEILSHFPKAKSTDDLMLDLGCGNSIHKQVAIKAGFNYVGIDYNELSQALILADAHALPFADNSFSFILSVAVLEHIQFPFVMISETNRVLKSKGKFLGTVAFLEPHHGNSFYHFSHLGIYNLLNYAKFKTKYVSPSRNWTVLKSQRSSLFPFLPKFLADLIILPTELLHRFNWWVIGLKGNKGSEENNRLLITSGAFSFVAIK